MDYVEKWLTKINIVEVKIFDREKNTNWKWYPYRMHLFKPNQKEGFYFKYEFEPTPIEEVLSYDNVIEGNVVYKKPAVRVKMVNGDMHRFYFDTVEECREWITKEQLDLIRYGQIHMKENK